MVHFPHNCAVVGFIRPPASTQKWLYPAPPVWFGVTVIWLFFDHGASNWLILESHRVSGQSGCLFLCQISCFCVCALTGVLSAQGQKPGRSHPGLHVQYWVCVCVRRGMSVGVLVAMRINRGAHGGKYRFRVCLCILIVFWVKWVSEDREHDMLLFLVSLSTSRLWTKCQTNALISLFHSVPSCPPSVQCLRLQFFFVAFLASFPLILPPLLDSNLVLHHEIGEFARQKKECKRPGLLDKHPHISNSTACEAGFMLKMWSLQTVAWQILSFWAWYQY